MIGRQQLLAGMTGLGLLLGSVSGATAANPPHEMAPAKQTTEFRRLEQPFSLKVLVTLSGMGLIGLELWWFLFSKTQAQAANTSQGNIQEVMITVDGGYDPSRVIVHVGQPVRLNFLRRDPSSCLEQVLLPDFHIAQNLNLNHTTPVEFTPEKPGQYAFTCGMNMFRGVIEVQG